VALRVPTNPGELAVGFATTAPVVALCRHQQTRR
jgi:hypothetical protein